MYRHNKRCFVILDITKVFEHIKVRVKDLVHGMPNIIMVAN